MRSMVEGEGREGIAWGEPPPPLRGPPPPPGEDFTRAALRLAGMVGLAFGWTPDTFWKATPAELAALATALRGEADPPDAATLARLKELFPDG